jgi:CubicO group peptidase (beta-lactamase class C family)
MMLVEEGQIALNTPVSRFVPEYAKTTVITRTDSGTVVVPARRQITMRDLLTHTAGISYGTDAIVREAYGAKGLGPAAGWGWYTADKDEPICTTMERLASLPFVRQPGEAFVYGYATDILGCVVERVSGMPLDRFFRTRITEPLGMRDTWFFVPPGARQRLVTVYASDATNHAVRAPDDARGQGHYVEGPRRSFAGGAGLVSSPRDWERFLRMLMNGGELDGVRLLSPASVDIMTTNQVGTLFNRPGMGWGLGFQIQQQPGGDDTLLPVGSWGWGSAYGGQYRVDPKNGIVLVIMINQLPNSTDIASKFPTLVYQALVK